jgi:hypothetical protein
MGEFCTNMHSCCASSVSRVGNDLMRLRRYENEEGRAKATGLVERLGEARCWKVIRTLRRLLPDDASYNIEDSSDTAV